MALLTPGNALSVAKNQYSGGSSSSGGSPNPNSSSSGRSSNGGTSSSSSDLFNPSWTGGGNGSSPHPSSGSSSSGSSSGGNYTINDPTYSVGYYTQRGYDYDTARKMLAQARANAGSTNNQTQPQQQQPLPQPQTQPQQEQQMWQNQQQQQQMFRQQSDALKAQNDAWMKRQEEMNRNMARMQAETPNFLTDRARFENMTGYANKSEQERKVVDDYWNNANIPKNKNANDYYNDIKNGVAIASHEQSRPEYAQAQSTIARIGKYKQMSSGQLASLFQTGQMTSGDLALLSKENPNLAMDVAFTNSLNNSGRVDFEKDQLSMSNDIIKNWYTDMNNDERIFLLSNALSNDANIQNAMNDTKEKANKLGELQKSVLTVSQDVDKELEGKNVSRSYAEALKAKRGSAIHTAIASAQIDYANAMNYQKDLIENKKYDIDYQRQLENRKFQVGQTLFMGRENQRISQENALYDTQLGLQKAQWEFEQKIAQDQRVQNDPRLATQAMIDSYRKQGVNAMRSDAEIIADIENQVANGRSLGEALTDLNKAFQGKTEYKTLQRLHNGQMSEAEKLQAQQNFQLKTMALSNKYDVDNMLMQYNLKQQSGREEAMMNMITQGIDPAVAQAYIRTASNDWKGASGTELLFAPEGTLIPTRLSETTNKNGGKECAEWVNDITGIGYGSSYASKLDKAKETRGTIGSVAVWQPSNNSKLRKYGHIGIIVGDDGQGNWLIKSSNMRVDGKISVDKVPKSKIDGYRSTNLGEKIMQSQYGGNKGNEAINHEKFGEYKDIKSAFASNAQVKAFEEVYSQGMNILSSLNDSSGAGDMAGIFSFMKSLDPSSVVRESEFEMAAKSAGVIEDYKNIFNKLGNGEALTQKQREAFKKIAKQFIENKAKIYETHYEETIRIMQNQGIPQSYYPVNIAQKMRETLGENGEQNNDNSIVGKATGMYNYYLDKIRNNLRY